MPKREDLRKILLIGSGPIVIGQACEFDYSGAQACKALREEGFRVILVNSNPATIMTDPGTADVTYIEPLNLERMTEIIEKERPDALLPTMGGQTALNCALSLRKMGVLDEFGVEMIGASREAIDMAEDRELFRRAMSEIGLESPRSEIVHSLEEALEKQPNVGFPTIIRPSFTMGGSGGGMDLDGGGLPRANTPPAIRGSAPSTPTGWPSRRARPSAVHRCTQPDPSGTTFSAPPVVVNGVVVIGHINNMKNQYPDSPAGVIRAFDARTGEEVWSERIPFTASGPFAAIRAAISSGDRSLPWLPSAERLRMMSVQPSSTRSCSW